MTGVSDASRAQIMAADPRSSTWVSANAGSGKTRVLTDRVARLLLAGTQPQKILCLTYTKAAASEMQNRLFARLGEWAMMPDEALQKTLAELGEGDVTLSADALRSARRLFASALETPGGLKIQTIHAFCDSLLRRFPLEAGVSPQFEIMEDRQSKQLCAEIIEAIAETRAPEIFDRVAAHMPGDNADDLVAEIIQNRGRFTNPVPPERFGVDHNTTPASIYAQVFLGGEEDLLRALIPHMQTASSKTDPKDAQRLGAVLATKDQNARLEQLETIFLYGASAQMPFGAKIGRVPTKAVQNTVPDLIDPLSQLMLRIETAREARLGYLAYQKTRAIFDFGQVFLTEYSARKAASGKLDYEDLIQKAQRLLTSSSMAQWVLFRLDGGIDHILVDEAQDTSPAQWSIIDRLHEEFAENAGSDGRARTLFVVGDEKQSIYSFQGADPAAFGEMREKFRTRLGYVDDLLKAAELFFSFRSAAPILDLVDNIFKDDTEGGFSGGVTHHAFDSEKPGRVDVWPFLEVEPEINAQPWYLPVDTPRPDDPNILLARAVAQHIKSLLDRRIILPGSKDNRAIRAQDVLILVQRRSSLFHALIKEMKVLDLPVAGADRLNVGAELAVRDLLSLLKFAVTPEDDLSLAEALRSPLLGVGEGQLFTLAQGRGARSLWENMRAHGTGFPVALSTLQDILDKADFLRPYEVLERILNHHQGRKALLARLGQEAEDGIDELLSQALRYEQVEAPTLTGFLGWFAAGDVNIKREMDAGSDRIRVMTVHGAKGLEAPIVILPDTAERAVQNRGQISKIGNDLAAWKTLADSAPKVQRDAEADRKHLEIQERMRLLYVALTRAEHWLIVCGAGKRGKDLNSWYNRVSAGMETVGADWIVNETGDKAQVLKNASWFERSAKSSQSEAKPPTRMQSWMSAPAPVVPHPPKPLSPSDLGGSKALFEQGDATDSDNGKLRGRQIHLLLEHLPGVSPKNRLAVAQRLLSSGPDRAENETIADLLAEADRNLDAPHLDQVFAPHALTEVAITARLGSLDNQIMDGIIDRLIVTDSKIFAIDFKSNATVPETAGDVPTGILQQMGAYLEALKQIYPDHEISVAILWTQSARLMPLPHGIVSAALKTASLS